MNASNSSRLNAINPKDEGVHDQCNIKFHKAELPFLLMVSTIANLVATVTLIRLLKKVKSKNLLLLTFLTANDLFSSVVLLISILTNTLTCDQFHHTTACKVLGWLGVSCFGLSIYLIGVINLERLLMVRFPIGHHNHVTFNKLWISLLLGVGISLILGGLPLVKVGAPFIYYEDNRFCGFDWSPWKQDNSSHAILVLFNAIYMLSVIVFIACSNILVLVRLRRRKRQFPGQSTTQPNHGHLASEKFSLLTKVVGAFNCVCNLPFFVKLVVDYVRGDTSLQGVEDSVTSILLFCTPIINPFLYLIFNKLYRQTLIQTIRKVFHCPRLCKTSIHPAGADDVLLESSNIHTNVSAADRKEKFSLPSTSQGDTLQLDLTDIHTKRISVKSAIHTEKSTQRSNTLQVTLHV